MSDEITLYNNKNSPYGLRVRLALIETGIPFNYVEVPLGAEKPEWFTFLVNPEGKVPAITYGPRSADPTHPSPESIKLSESLAIVEFVADLAATSGNPAYKQLYAPTPILRARARYAVEMYFNTAGNAAKPVFRPGGGQPDYALLYQGLDSLQTLLNESDGKYLIGDQFTTADAAIAPFCVRWEAFLEALGGETAEKTLADVRGEKFARFRKYVQDLKERESLKGEVDHDASRAFFTRFFERIRSLPA